MRLLTSGESGGLHRPLISAFCALAFVLLAVQPAKANDVSDFLCNVPFADQVCTAVDLAKKADKAVDFVSDPLGYLARAITNSVSSSTSALVKEVAH